MWFVWCECVAVPPVEISELTVLKGKGGCKAAADDVCCMLLCAVCVSVASVSELR